MNRYFELTKRLAGYSSLFLKNKNLQVLFLAMFSVLFFHNILLTTGFISDDAYNSQILGATLINNESIFSRFVSETVGWFQGAGRFFPLHWYFYFVYYFTQSEVLVKATGLVVVTLGLIFFCLLIGKLTKSKAAVLLSLMCIPAIFQTRAWHDPLLAFTFLLPMLFLYLASSLYFFQCFLETNKKKYLILSVILHLLGLLTYEANYLFFLCHISLVLFAKESFRTKLSKVLPILIVSFGVVLISILAKTKLNPYFNNGYPGAGVHLNPELTLTAFFYQAIAGVPLSYFLGTHPNIDRLAVWERLGILVFFIAVFYGLMKQKSMPKLSMLALGCSLFFPPAIIMAISGHQEEIVKAGIGYGYIPVYFQYFGFYLIYISVFYFVRETLEKLSSKLENQSKIWLERSLIFVGAFLFSHVANIHLQQNKAVAKSTYGVYLYPRKILDSAIKHGILDSVKNKDLLFQNKRYPADQDWFLATAAKRPLRVCDLNEVKVVDKCSLKYLFGIGEGLIASDKKANLKTLDLTGFDNWIIAYSLDFEKGSHGIVILAKIDEISADSGKHEILQLKVGSRLRVFDYYSKNMQDLSLTAASIDFLKMIAVGIPLSVQEVNFSAYIPELVFSKWYGKVHPLDGTPKDNVRWSSGEAELVLYNLSSKSRTVDLKAHIAAPANSAEKSQLKITEDSKVQIKTIGTDPYLYKSKRSLAPGATVINFSSDGKVISKDPRNLVFGIFNFQVAESSQHAKK